MSIRGFNFAGVFSSQSDLTVSPEFGVTVRAQNHNSRIGIYYKKGNNVFVSHTGTDFFSGVLPNFYQPRNNVIVFETLLRLQVSSYPKQIPLGVDIKVSARVK
ncbi:hypothetical protein MKX01_033386, partial [Papaver californicum]